MQTFYWYDYETWGSNPRVDRPVQFAGVRTDLNLNIIGEPHELYCRPPIDLLPHPEACLTHGITPQIAQERGLFEYQFAAEIHAQFSKPGTCVVGFNNINFDDEVTRHLFYRNFYDPYEREWSHGNSRWDILKLVRACYALRPEGIKWPTGDEGNVTFKLEKLAAENGIAHDAHNALSDVFATLDLARLIKEKHPKLFDYCFTLRNKGKVLQYLNLNSKKPFLHVSNMFSVNRYYAALMMPLAKHPTNSNAFICYDLSVDPSPFIGLDAEEIRDRVFTSNEKLQEFGVERVPLKSVRVNQCPMVCSDNVLNDNSITQRLQIDRVYCKANQDKILTMKNLPDKIKDIYQFPTKEEESDPEKMLYGGFIPDSDKYIMREIKELSGSELAKKQFSFVDKRLPELLFRYRARNFLETLIPDEKKKWDEFCYQRLTDPHFDTRIVLDDYKKELLRLEAENSGNAKSKWIFVQLSEHMNSLVSDLPKSISNRIMS